MRQPLLEAGLGKADIRAISRAEGLPTADKPSAACLASRFPYSMSLSDELLARTGRAEDHLRSLGFHELRVRLVDGATARIEVPAQHLARITDETVRGSITAKLRDLGFRYITVDLEGLRSGSQNEVLTDAERAEALGERRSSQEE